MIDLSKIHKGMDVMTSDGQRLGAIREVMGHVLFLDDAQAAAGERDVSVPLIWIIGIDDVVHLAKSRDQVQREWQAGAQSTL
ncbi:DUF2171 domain-containing protein [Microvirga roseola]|uniref:DUF2171 domain-containing protein n=1 Tax=Microvirga roseola TaxID=2883126 RepID=UPI001E621A22|nr:DUF2171 domain-containing protein [Microvirga roseola]